MKSLIVVGVVVLLAAAGIGGEQSSGLVTPIELTPSVDRYQAYWLMVPDKGERTQYQRVLVTRRPVEKLAGFNSTGFNSLLLDNIAMTFQTYQRDSLWSHPFQCVQQFGAVDATAKTVIVDGTTYLYESCQLEVVVRLLKNPLGTIPLHRQVHPLSGAEQTAKAFRLLLEEQTKVEK